MCVVSHPSRGPCARVLFGSQLRVRPTMPARATMWAAKRARRPMFRATRYRRAICKTYQIHPRCWMRHRRLWCPRVVPLLCVQTMRRRVPRLRAMFGRATHVAAIWIVVFRASASARSPWVTRAANVTRSPAGRMMTAGPARLVCAPRPRLLRRERSRMRADFTARACALRPASTRRVAATRIAASTKCVPRCAMVAGAWCRLRAGVPRRRRARRQIQQAAPMARSACPQAGRAGRAVPTFRGSATERDAGVQRDEPARRRPRSTGGAAATVNETPRRCHNERLPGCLLRRGFPSDAPRSAV